MRPLALPLLLLAGCAGSLGHGRPRRRSGPRTVAVALDAAWSPAARADVAAAVEGTWLPGVRIVVRQRATITIAPQKFTACVFAGLWVGAERTIRFDPACSAGAHVHVLRHEVLHALTDGSHVCVSTAEAAARRDCSPTPARTGLALLNPTFVPGVNALVTPTALDLAVLRDSGALPEDD
jgi:hypothetical protein